MSTYSRSELDREIEHDKDLLDNIKRLKDEESRICLDRFIYSLPPSIISRHVQALVRSLGRAHGNLIKDLTNTKAFQTS